MNVREREFCKSGLSVDDAGPGEQGLEFGDQSLCSSPIILLQGL